MIALIIPDTFKSFTRICRRDEKPTTDKIANQLALVTGGGKGFGRALCYRLLREKCDIAIVGVDYEAAGENAKRHLSKL